MDKIENHDWANTFSSISHNIVFRNERYTEVQSAFHEPGLASAQVNVIHTPGIELTHANFHAERKLTLIDQESSEKISSSYVMGGGVESKFSLHQDSIIHWGNTHGFQYTPNFDGKHIIHDGKMLAFFLTYDLAYFKGMAQSAGVNYLDKVLACMDRQETLIVPPGKMLLQPRMAELLHAITQCSFQGLTRYLFIEAKLLELLALQMEQFNTSGPGKDEWSRADRERLMAVHNYINNNYLEAATLASLCSRFGLNEFKLKKGYRHFFGSTVFGHIHKLRMQYAQYLLTSGQMNVSEVSFHIGYNNISSFSAAYKKFFGYLPGKVSVRCSVD